MKYKKTIPNYNNKTFEFIYIYSYILIVIIILFQI